MKKWEMPEVYNLGVKSTEFLDDSILKCPNGSVDKGSSDSSDDRRPGGGNRPK